MSGVHTVELPNFCCPPTWDLVLVQVLVYTIPEIGVHASRLDVQLCDCKVNLHSFEYCLPALVSDLFVVIQVELVTLQRNNVRVWAHTQNDINGKGRGGRGGGKEISRSTKKQHTFSSLKKKARRILVVARIPMGSISPRVK